MSDPDPIRYPIGKFHRPTLPLTSEARHEMIRDLERLPAEVRAVAHALPEARLDEPYRPGGWTARQVIHHVPDSHLNGYVRMKLAATEEVPPIKVYDEALWAELPEARTAPIQMSLDLLDALHLRWCAFLRSVPDSTFQRTFDHPKWGMATIEYALAIYAWHGKHHTAHLKSILNR